MSNLVRDWMSSPVIVIDPDSSVSHALTLMRRRNIHSLVVDIGAEKGRPHAYGIVTTTDIRDKIIAQDLDPAGTTVREIMTAPVICARPEWTLRECSQRMHEHDFHHMPVEDGENNLVGLISATDIFIAAEEIGWGKGAGD